MAKAAGDLRRTLQPVFEMLDADSSGSVSTEELATASEHLQLQLCLRVFALPEDKLPPNLRSMIWGGPVQVHVAPGPVLHEIPQVEQAAEIMDELPEEKAAEEQAIDEIKQDRLPPPQG